MMHHVVPQHTKYLQICDFAHVLSFSGLHMVLKVQNIFCRMHNKMFQSSYFNVNSHFKNKIVKTFLKCLFGMHVRTPWCDLCLHICIIYV